MVWQKGTLLAHHLYAKLTLYDIRVGHLRIHELGEKALELCQLYEIVTDRKKGTTRKNEMLCRNILVLGAIASGIPSRCQFSP